MPFRSGWDAMSVKEKCQWKQEEAGQLYLMAMDPAATSIIVGAREAGNLGDDCRAASVFPTAEAIGRGSVDAQPRNLASDDN
jgi:hypothetical protein